MSNLHRLMDVQFGLHADAANFLTMPGSLRRLMVKGGGESLLPPGMGFQDRNDIASLAGRGFPDQLGPLALQQLAPVIEWKGVNDNSGAAVASAAAWYAKMEQGEIVTSILGGEPAATSSAAPTVNSTGHNASAGELGVSGTALVAGQIILFPTSGGNRVRQVVSFGTGVAVLDRPYTGTPTTSGTIIRAAVWTWNPSVRNHVHGAFRVEDAEQMTEFVGCAPESLALALSPGQKVMATCSFMPTTAAPAGAKLSPSVTYPAAGSPCLAVNGEFMIGSETFVPTGDVSLTVNTGNEMRETASGPDGTLGGVQAEKRGNVTLALTLRSGASASRGEVQRDAGTESLRELLGLVQGRQEIRTTRDVAYLIGRSPGAATYIRMPDANVRATVGVDGTATAIALEIQPLTTMSIGVL